MKILTKEEFREYARQDEERLYFFYPLTQYNFIAGPMCIAYFNVQDQDTNSLVSEVLSPTTIKWVDDTYAIKGGKDPWESYGTWTPEMRYGVFEHNDIEQMCHLFKNDGRVE